MAIQKIRNMEEFAAMSGVSRPTVSKYFNDPASVRASTRAKIEQALEQCDYRPNIFAINQNRNFTTQHIMHRQTDLLCLVETEGDRRRWIERVREVLGELDT